METEIISRRKFLLIVFFSFVAFLAYFYFFSSDKQTKIVFCDVGQGDASYIRVRNRVDVLIDAGPDRKVLSCLGKHMPFWDRQIEIAFISHPQKDHFGGFLFLLDRYQIEKILMPPIDNPSQSFKKLKEKIVDKKSKIYFPKAGTKITILNNNKIEFYWPTEKFITNHLISSPVKTRANFQNVLGSSTFDNNNFSLIFLFEENNSPHDKFRVLFTGDATSQVLDELVSNKKHNDFPATDILKVPHHGSKNGLTKNFLHLANPRVAVISVGKNNSYGHPAKKVLEMLKAQGIKIKRTDEEGDVVFKLKIKNQKLQLKI